jgi:hypothetical protein
MGEVEHFGADRIGSLVQEFGSLGGVGAGRSVKIGVHRFYARQRSPSSCPER